MKHKSIVVSFRVQPLHVAKALDGLTSYDSANVPEALSGIVKATFLHGINSLCSGMPVMPTQTSLDTILTKTTQNTKTTKRKSIDDIVTLECTNQVIVDSRLQHIHNEADLRKAENVLSSLDAGLTTVEQNLINENEEIVRITKLIFNKE